MSSLIDETPLDTQIRELASQFSNILNSNQVTKYAFLVKAESLSKQLVDKLNEREIEIEVSILIYTLTACPYRIQPRSPSRTTPCR